MAKVKSKSNGSIPQKHAHSRASFLYQAAAYLDSTNPDLTSKLEPLLARPEESTHNASRNRSDRTKHSRYLVGHLKGVSLRAQTRMRPEMKRTLCKRCDTLLFPGTTAEVRVENHSKNGRKWWADVFVLQCRTCGTQKRFVSGAKPPAAAAESGPDCEGSTAGHDGEKKVDDPIVNRANQPAHEALG